MNPGDAEAEKKFKEASEAYAILSDAEKRKTYDQLVPAQSLPHCLDRSNTSQFSSAQFSRSVMSDSL